MGDTTAPYVVGSDTSKAAAESIAADSGQLREFVFSYIEKAGIGGMTCDEVEEAADMRHQTASARIRELAQKGRIVDSGRRRPTRSSRMAIVWIETPIQTPSAASTTVHTIDGHLSLFAKAAIDPAGEEGLAGLRRRCLSCVKCDLAKTRNKVVFGEGNVNEPSVCFVGEGPGGTEDDTGRPFVGKAGQFLNRVISAMKFTREDVYIVNSIACRPPNNRPPEKKELDACHEYLVGQLRAIRPKTLVALGGTAVAAFFGGKAEITKMRGKWLEWEGIPLMPTLHPSYLLRRSYDPGTSRPFPDFVDLKKAMWSDMQQVLHRLSQL
jgi:uracil-DNA glycosylase